MRRVLVVFALGLLVWLVVAHRYLPATPSSEPPAPLSLTDSQAMALIEKELVAHRVALDTVRIAIGGEPRRVSIRYSSAYSVDHPAFEPQRVLVALAVSRVLAGVQPPLDGGMRLSAIPAGEGEIGLKVTVIGASSLDAWANNALPEREFVSEWDVWSMTRE